jgi:hypothetical protein
MVRYGSGADILGTSTDVRFTPESGRPTRQLIQSCGEHRDCRLGARPVVACSGKRLIDETGLNEPGHAVRFANRWERAPSRT